MYEVDERGVLVAAFKIFTGYKEFEGYLALVKEEANYWLGYGTYLRENLRPDERGEELAEGLELVKLSTNLRQSIYSDERLYKRLDDKYAKIGQDTGYGLGPVEMKQYEDEKKSLEHRIVIKSFEMAKLREEWDYYLWQIDLPARQKAKWGRPKKEDAEDE